MSRKLVRHAAADWLTAAQIPGLDHVHPGKVKEIPWANYGTGSSAHMCQAYVLVDRRPEVRLAGGSPGSTGQPPNGQKEITSTVRVVVWFRSTDPDWLTAQDELDDITEAMLEQLRFTRTLGRPDVILAAGEFSAGIVQQDDEPEADDGGVMFARCTISFQTKEVINS
jgi:hypothetical protein